MDTLELTNDEGEPRAAAKQPWMTPARLENMPVEPLRLVGALSLRAEEVVSYKLLISKLGRLPILDVVHVQKYGLALNVWFPRVHSVITCRFNATRVVLYHRAPETKYFERYGVFGCRR